MNNAIPIEGVRKVGGGMGSGGPQSHTQCLHPGAPCHWQMPRNLSSYLGESRDAEPG